MARGMPGDIIVSERFREVAERHTLKDCWLVPAQKCAYDEKRRERFWYVRED